MNYLFCSRPDGNVVRLANSLGATLLKFFDGMHLWHKKARVPFKEGDKLICWGSTVPEIDGVKVLNALMKPVKSAEELWLKLYSVDIPFIQVVAKNKVKDAKSFIGGGYLPRLKGHKSGDDLLALPKWSGEIEYFTQKMPYTKEFRIHSFGGRSIKAGVREPQKGRIVGPNWDITSTTLAHPWVRTELGGWRVAYGDFKSSAQMRKMANSAVKGLGLHFASVDIAQVGEKENYTVTSIDLNPDLKEDVVFNAYVKHLSAWLTDKAEKDEEAPEPEKKVEVVKMPVNEAVVYVPAQPFYGVYLGEDIG